MDPDPISGTRARPLRESARRALNGVARSIASSPITLAAARRLARHIDPGDLAWLNETDARQLENLDERAAFLLNFEKSYLGYRAQAGLWLNTPIEVEYRRGGVDLLGINERIIELPYALFAASHLPAGARVLDVGAAESTFALSVASLGLDVTALDLRPYPFAHPRVTSVIARMEEWEPEGAYDAIFAISTLEHFGLGAYGESATTDPDADVAAVRRFAQWLSPTGRLVFSAPYGAASATPRQRSYDEHRLARLLSGWDVLERRVFLRRDRILWEEEPEDSPEAAAGSDRGVILLQARPLYRK